VLNLLYNLIDENCCKTQPVMQWVRYIIQWEDMMNSKLVLRLGIALAIVVTMVSAAFLPAVAASAPVITVTSVNPGSQVTFSVANMPVNVKLAVTMGAAGTAGFGPTVAHIVSGVGGTQTFTVEILSDVRGASQIAMRIDSGTGIAAFTTFNNVAFTAPAVPVATAVPTGVATLVPTAVPTATPVLGTGGAVNTTLRVIHVQQGGWVQVLFNNLPLSTSFAVTLGPSGSKGLGGFLVAHMKTNATGPIVATGTFEIPQPLHDAAVIDARFEGGGFVFVVTFSNVNF
jgi:hypothetical protein